MRRVEVVRRRQHLFVLVELQAAVQQPEAHRRAVGERELVGVDVEVARRGACGRAPRPRCIVSCRSRWCFASRSSARAWRAIASRTGRGCDARRKVVKLIARGSSANCARTLAQVRGSKASSAASARGASPTAATAAPACSSFLRVNISPSTPVAVSRCPSYIEPAAGRSHVLAPWKFAAPSSVLSAWRAVSSLNPFTLGFHAGGADNGPTHRDGSTDQNWNGGCRVPHRVGARPRRHERRLRRRATSPGAKGGAEGTDDGARVGRAIPRALRA